MIFRRLHQNTLEDHCPYCRNKKLCVECTRIEWDVSLAIDDYLTKLEKEGVEIS